MDPFVYLDTKQLVDFLEGDGLYRIIWLLVLGRVATVYLKNRKADKDD